MLDAFNTDAFSLISLTAAINKLPFQPTRLGQMGLFQQKGITTLQAMIEEQQGKLSLIPTAARGTMPNVYSGNSRNARSFRVPHIPLNAAVMADDVQNVRAFGSEDQTEGVAQVVNDKLTSMRQAHETTWEYHRVGAIQGIVLDADGTTELYNWFDEFGITEVEVDFAFDSDEDTRLKALEVARAIEDVLGQATYTGIHAMCGNNFFDHLISSPDAKAAFDRWQNGQFFRDGAPRGGFEWAGIMWENYRGKIGSIDFIDADTARFFPTGVVDLFQHVMAPANFTETVNTPGLPIYAKQEAMKFGMGVDLHTQSNPLMICTQPGVLIKGNDTKSSS